MARGEGEWTAVGLLFGGDLSGRGRITRGERIVYAEPPKGSAGELLGEEDMNARVALYSLRARQGRSLFGPPTDAEIAELAAEAGDDRRAA